MHRLFPTPAVVVKPAEGTYLSLRLVELDRNGGHSGMLHVQQVLLPSARKSFVACPRESRPIALRRRICELRGGASAVFMQPAVSDSLSCALTRLPYDTRVPHQLSGMQGGIEFFPATPVLQATP
jgi:hypothetical protein